MRINFFLLSIYLLRNPSSEGEGGKRESSVALAVPENTIPVPQGAGAGRGDGSEVGILPRDPG